MVLRENEVREWLKDQKSLLESQHTEKGVLKACKKRLQAIERSLDRNNDLLRKS